MFALVMIALALGVWGTGELVGFLLDNYGSKLHGTVLRIHSRLARPSLAWRVEHDVKEAA